MEVIKSYGLTWGDVQDVYYTDTKTGDVYFQLPADATVITQEAFDKRSAINTANLSYEQTKDARWRAMGYTDFKGDINDEYYGFHPERGWVLLGDYKPGDKGAFKEFLTMGAVALGGAAAIGAAFFGSAAGSTIGGASASAGATAGVAGVSTSEAVIAGSSTAVATGGAASAVGGSAAASAAGTTTSGGFLGGITTAGINSTLALVNTGTNLLRRIGINIGGSSEQQRSSAANSGSLGNSIYPYYLEGTGPSIGADFGYGAPNQGDTIRDFVRAATGGGIWLIVAAILLIGGYFLLKRR